MKISRLIYIIAVIIILAWLINGLLYVAAIIVIIGLVVNFIEQRKKK